MQYKIILVPRVFVFSNAGAIEKFTAEVNKAIALGWEPSGGLAVYGNALYQAMIKRAK
jgi:hypothetical protein